MKKIILLLAVIAAVGFTSCSKEKDCTCTSSTTMPGIPESSVKGTIEDGECSDGDSESTTAGFTTTIKCVED